mgnify:FL=1|jgi:ABC-type branched-chain amino acid transport systems, periplasmic component
MARAWRATSWWRRVCSALGGLSALGLVLSGCTGPGSNEGNVIHVAASAPLTGDGAAYGIETMYGVRLAVREINESGGIAGKQIKLTEFDDQCDATPAATVANQIISDKSIVAVIGNVCSGATNAQLPIFDRAGLPVLAATTSNPNLSTLGFDIFSRIIPNDDVQAASTVKFAAVLGYTRIAVLYPSDDYGQAMFTVAQRAAEEYDIEIVAAETYITGSTTDFSSVLANIAAANPQAVFLAGYYADMGTAVSQSRRAFGDKQIAFLANAQDQNQEFIDLAGEAGEGTWVTNVYDVTNPSEVNQRFVTAYEEAYGNKPGLQAAAGYDNVYVLKAAVEANGGSTENLAAAIRSVVYEGAMGRISFDENGDNPGGGTVVLQLRGGEWVFDTEKTEALNGL